MQFVRNFRELFRRVALLAERKRVAVVYPHDEHTQEAIEAALERGFADFVLVGRADELRQLPFAQQYADHLSFEQADDADAAAARAVAIVREGQADVLMKGKINSDNFLRAVLNKEHGLLPKGRVLSHVTVAEVPDYDKLLVYTDVAVIPEPTLAQREAQIGYAVDVCHSLGIEEPRVALIHFTEKVNPKFPISTDYQQLKATAAEGRWGRTVVDGPMDVITAVDPEAGAIKGIVSPIEGRADVLMMPDMEAANVFYKTLSHFGHAVNAGMVVGTIAPVVLPSRGDSSYGKLASLVLACLQERKS